MHHAPRPYDISISAARYFFVGVMHQMPALPPCHAWFQLSLALIAATEDEGVISEEHCKIVCAGR
jgi:hypothetical protein